MMTGASSYQDAWAKTISPVGMDAWLRRHVANAGGVRMLPIIIGDLGYDLLKGLGIEGWFAVRNNLLASVSVALLLPLASSATSPCYPTPPCWVLRVSCIPRASWSFVRSKALTSRRRVLSPYPPTPSHVWEPI